MDAVPFILACPNDVEVLKDDRIDPLVAMAGRKRETPVGKAKIDKLFVVLASLASRAVERYRSQVRVSDTLAADLPPRSFQRPHFDKGQMTRLIHLGGRNEIHPRITISLRCGKSEPVDARMTIVESENDQWGGEVVVTDCGKRHDVPLE